MAWRLFKELKSYSTEASKKKSTSTNFPDTDVPKSLLDNLQEYFFLTVTTVIKSAHDEKFTCPVQVYLACFGYNEDDTFKLPSQLTSPLANWQYLLRCTALYEANRLVESRAVDSVLT